MSITTGIDSLKCRQTLTAAGQSYDFFNIKAAEATLGDLSRLPFSMKVVLENLLRREDGRTVKVDDLKAIAQWLKDKKSDHEIAYLPARVLMQDFTGVPAVADLAAMREAMRAMGGDANKINPLCAVDLVIDHSVMVDHYGTASAFQQNVDIEFERNGDRYKFLRWAQKAFDNLRVVPPGTGICHQVNVEYLAQTVWVDKDQNGKESCLSRHAGGHRQPYHHGQWSGVLGWGVGGIEAEAAMLGQPVTMLLPEVIGVRWLVNRPKAQPPPTFVLTVTQMLRKRGVVEKFVEFCGPGLDHLTLADRATIANMAPEYGATCGIFPIDQETIELSAPHRP
jgi:aconitate hydratase